METYFIAVIEDLVVTAVLAGTVFAFARSRMGEFGTRIVLGAGIAALVASAVMAYFKQNTAHIATGDWNLGIFIAALAVFILLFVCLLAILVLQRRYTSSEKPGAQGAQGKTALDILHTVVLFGLFAFLFLRLFYKLPDVINYPATIAASVATLLSSDFAYRFVGYLLGLGLVALVALASAKAFKALDGRPIGLATAAIVTVICFVQSMSLFQILIARRIIAKGTMLYGVLFPLTSWVNNHNAIFTLLVIVAVIVLAGSVIAMSLLDREPYHNPAMHRRNKAVWRNRRRWAICLIVCLLVSFVSITVVKDYATRGPELAESEECEIRDEGMFIPLSQVDDGHLHRFTFETTAGYTTASGYTTQGGVGVRVIVIKKPNSNAYGIGLDACDICGTTGYYERDGQVVCNKCDVVMNINTIGFKGGCNPIVIDYTIDDGVIFIASETLLEYEKIPGSSW